MKRDLDLVRKILLEVEEKDDGRAFQYTSDNLEPLTWYNVCLMVDAGLLNRVGNLASGNIRKVQLSWEGHEFLDSIRNEDVWTKTKEKLSAVGGTAALDVIKSVATNLITAAVS